MRHSKRSLEGELLIDHRSSPGLSAEDAAWMGVAARDLGQGCLLEMAIVTCAHCSALVIHNPERTRPREWCSHCDKYICDDCALVLHLTLQCRSVNRRVDEWADAVAHGIPPALLPKL